MRSCLKSGKGCIYNQTEARLEKCKTEILPRSRDKYMHAVETNTVTLLTEIQSEKEEKWMKQKAECRLTANLAQVARLFTDMII